MKILRSSRLYVIFLDIVNVCYHIAYKCFQEIDDFHPNAPFKYLNHKPVRDLHGEQFLKMWQAEQEQLVKIKICIDADQEQGCVILIAWYMRHDALYLIMKY